MGRAPGDLHSQVVSFLPTLPLPASRRRAVKPSVFPLAVLGEPKDVPPSSTDGLLLEERRNFVGALTIFSFMVTLTLPHCRPMATTCLTRGPCHLRTVDCGRSTGPSRGAGPTTQITGSRRRLKQCVRTQDLTVVHGAKGFGPPLRGQLSGTCRRLRGWARPVCGHSTWVMPACT